MAAASVWQQFDGPAGLALGGAPLGDLFVTSPDTEHPVAAGSSVALSFLPEDVVLLSD